MVISALMVWVHNSGIAVFSAIISGMVAGALMHSPRIRSVVYALAQFLSDLLAAPLKAWDSLGGLLRIPGGRSSTWRWARHALIPLVLVFIFIQLYRGGNERFDALSASIFGSFWSWIAALLEDFFTARTLFFLFALCLCGALLFRLVSHSVSQAEGQWSDALLRRKQRRPHWSPALSMDPLERERRKGILLLAMVNLVLAVVNIIDISWIWFGFEVEEGMSLKAFVHEGTYMLIISILLSMLILLYLFRGNQNFYWRSGILRTLAVVWVAQNFILGTSVFLRNYHYISFHGLAYKRIGVIVFLVLVLIGLITLFLKIRDRRSFFYLLRVNSWAAFTVMVALTLVDMDRLIVRYNLAHENQGEVDIDNYLALSDRVLPLLYGDLEKVEQQMRRHSMNRVRWVEHLEPERFREVLDRRSKWFMEEYGKMHPLERSLALDRTYKELERLLREVPQTEK